MTAAPKEPTLLLPYPDDRVNGFVALTDGGGKMYVTDFSRSYDTGTEAGNAMKYAGAFLILAKRYDQQLVNNSIISSSFTSRL